MKISNHFKNRNPSVIRSAQISFSKRKDIDDIKVINMAIGNISLPMYPAMLKRLKSLGVSRLSDGVVRYTQTVGTKNARNAFLNILSAEGFDTSGILSLVTDGGSAAMELMLLGVCGPGSKRPFLFLDPTYTNYKDFSNRLLIPTISTNRIFNDEGEFSDLEIDEIESLIVENQPAGLLVIPYDNPTGQYLPIKVLCKLGELAVRHDIWIVSDEAYRSLAYSSSSISSIWSLNESNVKGITGRRISIESASKVWNACGLRIGGLLTDNQEFHDSAVSEYTANLCANTLGQEIFGVLSSEPHKKILEWQNSQKNYYKSISNRLKLQFQDCIPGLIVTIPEAAIYFVIDFRNIIENFDTTDFINYCATKGRVELNGDYYTLLLAPMSGFYDNREKGKTQVRVAMVETLELMELAPQILKELFYRYKNLS